MGNIPLLINDVAPETRLPSSYADANAFGAQVGAAQIKVGSGIQAVGEGVGNLGRGVGQYLEQQRKQDAAASTANFDYQGRYLENLKKAPANGAGFKDLINTDVDTAINDYVGKIPDNRTREEARVKLMAQKPGWLSRAATEEYNQTQKFQAGQANDALTTTINKARTDPGQFDQAFKDGVGVIDANPAMSDVEKIDAKRKFEQSLSNYRWQGALSNAKSVDDINAMEAELTGKDSPWQSRMSPADYDRTVDNLKSTRKAFQSQASTAARESLAAMADRANGHQLIPSEEIQSVERLAKESGDYSLLYGVQKVKYQQYLDAAAKGKTPAQVAEMRQAMEGGNSPQLPANVHPAVREAVDGAAAVTGTSGSYLAGLFNKEANKEKAAAGDFGFGTDGGTSSAVGLAQFTDGTWLSVMRSPAGRAIVGEKANLSDPELLKLRADPKLSMIAAGLYARQNKGMLEEGLKRPVNDAEVYMAHFMGGGGALAFLRAYAANPGGSAAEMMPDAAAANKGVFYKEGQALTVQQVYNNIAGSFERGASRIGYAGLEHARSIEKNMQDGLKKNPMDFATEQGTAHPGPLSSAADFAARSSQALITASQYEVPRTDMKPFTSAEEAQLVKTVKDGSADQVVDLMAKFQAMDPQMAAAARKQVGADDAGFAHAAGLYGSNPGVAADIVKGSKALRDDPNVAKQIGDHGGAMEQAWGSAMPALAGLPNDARAGVFEAAKAYYAQNYLMQGKNLGAFKPEDFKASVNAVMGGTGKAPAIGEVNGAQTVLPPGVDAHTFDVALNAMTTTDYIAASKDGNPPRYKDGGVILPGDIATEGKFVANGLGTNEYQIRMGDGTFAVSSAADAGGFKAYVFKADPRMIRDKASTFAPTIDRTPVLPGLTNGPAAPAPAWMNNLGAAP